MNTAQPNSLSHFFSHNDYKHPSVIWTFFWSLVGGLLLSGAIFCLFLIFDLGATSGTLDRRLLTPAEREELARMAGAVTSSAENEVIADVKALEQPNQGLLPTIWRTRETIWSGLIAALYRINPLFRSTKTALPVLIVLVLFFFLAWGMILAMVRNRARRIGIRTITRVRKHLHRQALRLSPSSLEPVTTQHVVQLFTKDMQSVQEGIVHQIATASRAFCEIVLLLLMAFSFSWRLTFQCMVPLLVCWYLIQAARQKQSTAQQAKISKANLDLNLLTEHFFHTKKVSGYLMEESEHAQFQQKLERYNQELSIQDQISHWGIRFQWILSAFAMGLVLYFLINRTIDHPLFFPISMSATLLILFYFLRQPVESLWRLYETLAPARAGAERIHRYLQRVPPVSQAVGAKFIQPVASSIRFDSVSYEDPESKRKMLIRLDLEIKAGQRVALLSIDPLEARTLVSLLPRFIEPQSGRVLYDGEDIAWATLESLRAETIYVDASNPIFTGTVLENISCRQSHYSLNEVTDAAKLAHAHNFILKLNQGYETALGQHGDQLQPGQSFRLALARAALHKPAVLIIDEPTEELDEGSKNLVDDAYHRLASPERTMIFLPTRLATVRSADLVVLIHQGQVHAMGSQSSLVQNSPLYRHWEYTRFNEFRHQ